MARPAQVAAVSVPCRSCMAAIVWREHARTGAVAPIDAEPVEGGNIRLLPDGRYEVAAEPDLFGEPRYVSHYATCPDADRWREAAKRSRARTDDDAGGR